MDEKEDEGMKLIGLVGRAGAGKTFVANHLVQKYGFRRLSFGDPLKEMLLAAGMCTKEELWGDKTEHSRWLLQKVGTDIFRKQVDPLFWVRRTAGVVNKHIAAGGRVVLDDIRFPEEANLVRSYLSDGLLIRLERGDYTDPTAGTTHESESLVSTIECDHIITANSGEVDRLIWQMDEIMKGVVPIV
jgi:hypothetical protein